MKSALEQNRKHLLLWYEINLLNNEISFLQDKIATFPYGSVQADLESELDGIYGLYKVNNRYDFARYACDKKDIKKTVHENNRLVLYRSKVEAKAISMSEEKEYSLGNDYSMEKPKIKTLKPFRMSDKK